MAVVDLLEGRAQDAARLVEGARPPVAGGETRQRFRQTVVKTQPFKDRDAFADEVFSDLLCALDSARAADPARQRPRAQQHLGARDLAQPFQLGPLARPLPEGTHDAARGLIVARVLLPSGEEAALARPVAKIEGRLTRLRSELSLVCHALTVLPSRFADALRLACS